MLPEQRQEIIQRYRRVARLPDGLFAFTFPLRKKAVEKLALRSGDGVLEIGCGSGANFPYLVDAVGSSGQVVGLDISPEMVLAARQRVAKHGWKNVQVVEAAAEEPPVEGSFDGLLFFANHDVLTSPLGLENSLAPLREGGRVVAAGPRLADGAPGRLLNPVVKRIYHRFSVSSQDMDQPWRLLKERIPDLHVELHGPGIFFLAWGEKRAG